VRFFIFNLFIFQLKFSSSSSSSSSSSFQCKKFTLILFYSFKIKVQF